MNHKKTCRRKEGKHVLYVYSKIFFSFSIFFPDLENLKSNFIFIDCVEARLCRAYWSFIRSKLLSGEIFLKSDWPIAEQALQRTGIRKTIFPIAAFPMSYLDFWGILYTNRCVQIWSFASTPRWKCLVSLGLANHSYCFIRFDWQTWPTALSLVCE